MTEVDRKMTLFASLFAIQFMLDPYDEFTDIDDVIDRGLEYNPESEDCKFHMNIAIIKLLNEGYTEDEILGLIDSITVQGMNSLTEEQKDYVRSESKKLILERKERINYE